MTLDQTANFVRGEVSSSIASGDTTINVVDASIYPDPVNGNYNLVIWDTSQYTRPDGDPDTEVFRVTGRDTTNDTLTVSRGQEGTTAVSHPSSSEMHLSATSKFFTDIDTKLFSSLTISGNNGLNGGSAQLGGTVNVGISGNLSLDSDLVAVDGEVIWDESATYIPQGRLQNDSMTIAGNSVSLGGSTAINHTNLSNINSDDHHTKYSNSDAISAVDGSTLSSGLTLNGRLNMGSDDLYFQPSSSGGSVTAITFESNTNAGSDFGYIEYHDNYWGGNEGAALRLRSENDDGSAGPDSIVLSGAGGAIVDRDALKVQGADIEEVGTDGNTINQTIYDSSNSYIPQGALQNDTITVTGGTDISGGSASLGGSVTVDHADTSTQGNVSTGGATVIDDIDLDGRGHVTNLNTQNRSLDDWATAVDDNLVEFGSNADFSIAYESSADELVIRDETNGVDLIRQPKQGATEFIQGADIGSIEAPEDSFTQLASAAATSASTSGDTIGYTFAVDNQTGFEVSATSDGSGGLSSGPIASLGGDLEAANGETIWDESNTYIPQGRLQNNSVTVAGNTVALGSSTTVAYIDLNDTGSSFPIPNTDLANSSVTIEGNTVSLGGSTSVNHNDLSVISTDDHHTKYTDENAQDAVGAIMQGAGDSTVTYDDANNTITIETTATWS